MVAVLCEVLSVLVYVDSVERSALRPLMVGHLLDSIPRASDFPKPALT